MTKLSLILTGRPKFLKCCAVLTNPLTLFVDLCSWAWHSPHSPISIYILKYKVYTYIYLTRLYITAIVAAKPKCK